MAEEAAQTDGEGPALGVGIGEHVMGVGKKEKAWRWPARKSPKEGELHKIIINQFGAVNPFIAPKKDDAKGFSSYST